MSEKLAKVLTSINTGNEGDGVDRLHFAGAPKVCMMCLGLLLLLKFMNIIPIVCWVPYMYTSQDWVEYATMYCYVSNTFLPMNREVFGHESLHDVQDGNVFYLRYFQWVQFIFIIIAIAFYLPRLIWQGILEAEGVNITAMVKTVNGFESAMDVKKRETALDHLTKYLMVHFQSKNNRRLATTVSPFKRIVSRVTCTSRSDPSYVGKMYLLVKALQMVNCVAIMFAMNLWLDGYHLYGFDVIRALFQDNYSEVNKFPYLTFCNLTKKEMTENNEHSFVCLLTMNIFYEKIFTLFWFYLLYVVIVTLLNVIGWFRNILQGGRQAAFMKHMLIMSHSADFDESNAKDMQDFKEFMRSFLKPDGVFVFQMIARNTTSIVMVEVIGKVWNLFKGQKAAREEANRRKQEEAEAMAAKADNLYPTLPTS